MNRRSNQLSRFPNAFSPVKDVLDDDEEILLGEEILGNVDRTGFSAVIGSNRSRSQFKFLDSPFSVEKAESVLQKILLLDPPGIERGICKNVLSRNSMPGNMHLRSKSWESDPEGFLWRFQTKRFDNLDTASTSPGNLKKVIELFTSHPKPGEGESLRRKLHHSWFHCWKKIMAIFIITLNDRNIPNIGGSTRYKQLVTPKGKKVRQKTKDFVKKKFEAAKWFMLHSPAGVRHWWKWWRLLLKEQRTWFEKGESLQAHDLQRYFWSCRRGHFHISRVVNSKYVQTEFGVHSCGFLYIRLESENGEDVSNQVVKQRVKDIIATEPPQDPWMMIRLPTSWNRKAFTLPGALSQNTENSLDFPSRGCAERFDSLWGKHSWKIIFMQPRSLDSGITGTLPSAVMVK